MMTLVASLTSGALVLLLAGCATTTPTPAPTFGFGDEAVSIARSVTACRAASTQAIPAGTTGITSVATCLITGNQIDFVVWKDAASQKADGPVTTATEEAYVAHGDGWDAVTHNPGRISAQKGIAETIVASAGGRVVHVG